MNLCYVLQRRNEEYCIDVFRREKNKPIDGEIVEYISNIYAVEELLNKQYDILFITNPTAMHYSSIQKYVDITKHMFIEKPVFADYTPNLDEIGLKKDGIYYVACPLRYNAVLQYVKQKIDLNDVISVQAISSSYLPDWRPGIDYRDTYSAHKELGGGVAIDLIHEWDYITHIFGFPEETLFAGGKFSNLDIDCEDLATYIGIYDNTIIEVHLDYFGREVQRKLVLYTKKDTIVCDIAYGVVSYLKEKREISLTEERNEYQKREIEHFLDIIDDVCQNDNDIENANKVLKIALNKK